VAANSAAIALGVTEHGRAFGADGIRDRANVVNAGLQVRHTLTRSESPVPRLSKMIRRQNDASRLRPHAAIIERDPLAGKAPQTP
jgi:hypothetical protein